MGIRLCKSRDLERGFKRKENRNIMVDNWDCKTAIGARITSSNNESNETTGGDEGHMEYDCFDDFFKSVSDGMNEQGRCDDRRESIVSDDDLILSKPIRTISSSSDQSDDITQEIQMHRLASVPESNEANAQNDGAGFHERIENNQQSEPTKAPSGRSLKRTLSARVFKIHPTGVHQEVDSSNYNSAPATVTNSTSQKVTVHTSPVVLKRKLSKRMLDLGQINSVSIKSPEKEEKEHDLVDSDKFQSSVDIDIQDADIVQAEAQIPSSVQRAERVIDESIGVEGYSAAERRIMVFLRCWRFHKKLKTSKGQSLVKEFQDARKVYQEMPDGDSFKNAMMKELDRCHVSLITFLLDHSEPVKWEGHRGMRPRSPKTTNAPRKFLKRSAPNRIPTKGRNRDSRSTKSSHTEQKDNGSFGDTQTPVKPTDVGEENDAPECHEGKAKRPQQNNPAKTPPLNSRLKRELSIRVFEVSPGEKRLTPTENSAPRARDEMEARSFGVEPANDRDVKDNFDHPSPLEMSKKKVKRSAKPTKGQKVDREQSPNVSDIQKRKSRADSTGYNKEQNPDKPQQELITRRVPHKSKVNIVSRSQSKAANRLEVLLEKDERSKLHMNSCCSPVIRIDVYSCLQCFVKS